MADTPHRAFNVGERVLVTGGYDAEPTWLAGGHGYVGTLRDIVGDYAAVELDEELELQAGGHRWQDFGDGSAAAIRELDVARGKWLALSQGWMDQRWEEPTGRLHVGLCSQRPGLGTIPAGGGIGVWVESHAGMKHVDRATQD